MFILSLATKYYTFEVGCLHTTVHFQWNTFRWYITAQPKDDIKEQLKVCLAITVGTASVERSFSQTKMIKT